MGWLKTESAAKYADVSPRKIKEWRGKGLRHIVVNARLKLTKEEWVDQFLEGQDKQPNLDAIVRELQER